MKRILVIVTALILGLQLHGQYRFHHPEIFMTPTINPEYQYNPDVSHLPGMTGYFLNSGMSFVSLNGFNSVTSWISPKAFIPVTSNLAIEVGGTFLSSNILGTGDFQGQRMNDFIAFARGIYTVNEKLTVWGEYSRSLVPTGQLGRYNYQNFTIGGEYFITPNLRLGASVTSIQGPDPYYLMSPYGPSHFIFY